MDLTQTALLRLAALAQRSSEASRELAPKVAEVAPTLEVHQLAPLLGVLHQTSRSPLLALRDKDLANPKK